MSEMDTQSIHKVALSLEEKEKEAAPCRIADYIQRSVSGSLTGCFFTSYKSGAKRRSFGALGRFASRVREKISKRINSSFTVSFFGELSRWLLSLKLKGYGVFLATFGIYTVILFFAENFLFSDTKGIFEIFVGVALALLSLPLLLSDDTLSEGLLSSSVGRGICNICGIPRESVKCDGSASRLNYCFIAGVAAGLLSYAIGPFSVLLLLLFVVAVWIIAARPELSVVLISFLIPFAKMSQIMTLMGVGALFFCIKVIRGKRYIAFETLDYSVLSLFFIILAGTLVNAAGKLSVEGLRCCVLLFGYFLTVCLMRSRKWLNRMTSSLIFGFSLAGGVVIMGFVGDFLLDGVSSALGALFKGSMLGEVLTSGDLTLFSRISVILLPTALSLLLRPSFKVNKLHALIATAILFYPVVADGFTLSTASAFAGVLILLLIYSKKFVYLLLGAVLAIPTAAFVFPSYFDRIMGYTHRGFEGAVDKVSAVWRGTCDMLGDFFAGGIGFGGDAWSRIYPMYAVEGAEGAPHAYSMYFSALAEGGVFGLILLIVFFVVFTRRIFTVTSNLTEASRHPALRHSGVRENVPDSLSAFKLRTGKSDRMSVGKYCMSGRIGAASPFAGVVAAAVYGIFDSVWYDERAFLVFWLTAALGAAYAATVEGEIDDFISSYEEIGDREQNASVDI